ncbi:MAG: hypothetical protein JSS49_03945 [Planctomycetes bacterium]|nr:hypothetical protein [Planctomycetota bacterium]
MNPVHRILEFVQDSPTFGRDRATLVSGVNIGTIGLLLNCAVLMLVLPLLLAADDRVVRNFTDNVEFGQLLAMILLGGSAALATLLIPLRLVTVFWEPRISRYFDQIVLSGISPLRFVIGKATSQNLFLALILFLLLPYLVMSFTLGGVNLSYFAAGLFLVWLYCMTLALVTLWVSLYLNELLAAMVVIFAATSISILGCYPMRIQPFVVTPFPALIHPLLTSIPGAQWTVGQDFLRVFLSCVCGMTVLSCLSLAAVYLGPLYGIIRENSTFGEVIREGDTRRKRWFRVRQHIQRSSEVAFFYQNRGRFLLRHEGLLRWGLAFGVLMVSEGAGHFVVASSTAFQMPRSQYAIPWWALQHHASFLLVHGVSLILAALLFSHGKNTTYQRLSFWRGRTVAVSTLDSVAFLLFVFISTGASMAMPFLYEQHFAGSGEHSIFPELDSITLQGRQIDFYRIPLEGSIVVSIVGIVIYALQRRWCLLTWIRSTTFFGVGFMYYVFICGMPVLIAVIAMETHEIRSLHLVPEVAPSIGMISPIMVAVVLFNGELGRPFPSNVSTLPFYIVHAVLLGLTLIRMRRSGSDLREMYLPDPPQEAAHA